MRLKTFKKYFQKKEKPLMEKARRYRRMHREITQRFNGIQTSDYHFYEKLRAMYVCSDDAEFLRKKVYWKVQSHSSMAEYNNLLRLAQSPGVPRWKSMIYRCRSRYYFFQIKNFLKKCKPIWNQQSKINSAIFQYVTSMVREQHAQVKDVFKIHKKSDYDIALKISRIGWEGRVEIQPRIQMGLFQKAGWMIHGFYRAGWKSDRVLLHPSIGFAY